MRQALVLFGLVVLVFAGIDLILGHAVFHTIAFGSISVMAAMISATFLWLWVRRETPLALGMSFSWAGTASVLGWWWVHESTGSPNVAIANALLLVFAALHFVGAILHFAVIQRTIPLGMNMFMSIGFCVALISTAFSLIV